MSEIRGIESQPFIPSTRLAELPVSSSHRLPQPVDWSRVDPKVREAAQGMEAIFLDYLMKVMREEKKLANPRLVTQAIKEVTNLSDKIYEYIKVFDVNGKLATIDLQSIEAT